MFGNFDRDLERMMNCFGNDFFQPFPMFSNMLGNGMDQMNQMNQMNQMSQLGPIQNLISFSSMPGQNMSFSSSVTTYSSDGNGKPQIYQSTKSQICGPDGFKETTETLKDSKTGIHQMKYGRHIHDRAHIQQKKRNVYNGEEEEEDEFVNLEEEEAEQFHNEFKQKKSEYKNNYMIGYGPYNNNNNNNSRLALTEGPSTSNSIPTTSGHKIKPISKLKKTKEIIEEKLRNQKNKIKKERKPYGKN